MLILLMSDIKGYFQLNCLRKPISNQSKSFVYNSAVNKCAGHRVVKFLACKQISKNNNNSIQIICSDNIFLTSLNTILKPQYLQEIDWVFFFSPFPNKHSTLFGRVFSAKIKYMLSHLLTAKLDKKKLKPTERNK